MKKTFFLLLASLCLFFSCTNTMVNDAASAEKASLALSQAAASAFSSGSGGTAKSLIDISSLTSFTVNGKNGGTVLVTLSTDSITSTFLPSTLTGTVGLSYTMKFTDFTYSVTDDSGKTEVYTINGDYLVKYYASIDGTKVVSDFVLKSDNAVIKGESVHAECKVDLYSRFELSGTTSPITCTYTTNGTVNGFTVKTTETYTVSY